ncbi:MAG: hypothetical protein LUI07_02850, partial [Lachnospiraceae bacterium]|nr:hypothetical protein [Lachnospiraceae bacterium]
LEKPLYIYWLNLMTLVHTHATHSLRGMGEDIERSGIRPMAHREAILNGRMPLQVTPVETEIA